MNALRKFVPRYTVADYRQWEGDWELWDGTAVSMAPGPFGRHGAMTSRLVTQLSNSIEAEACDAEVLGEVDWIVSDTTVVRPDISVVCGPPPERHIQSAPALVAEVLSQSTRENDQIYKCDLYRDQGVANYLIVDPDSNELTHYRKRESGIWIGTLHADLFQIPICDDCKISIDPQKLFR